MDDNLDNIIDEISLLDQLGTSFANTAVAFAAYYNALVGAGLPQRLAEKLTADMHSLWWSNNLYSGSDDKTIII